MLAFAYYLLKVVACSGLLYAWYFFVLRNKRFHQYNRFYLLAITMLAWIIPVCSIELWVEPVEELSFRFLTVVSSTDAIVAKQKASFFTSLTAEQTAALFYSVVASFFLLTLMVSLFKIRRLISQHVRQLWHNITFVFIDGESPFSFFRYIFWNREIDIESPKGQQIFNHELVHVKERHSLDKLLIDLILIPGWVNPFFWLIRKELSMIHEFIADQQSIAHGDVNAFAEMLLHSAYPTHQLATTNSFFHSPIKRRLIMLTTSNKTNYSYARRLLVLPILALVVVLFAFKAKEKLTTVITPVETAVRNAAVNMANSAYDPEVPTAKTDGVNTNDVTGSTRNLINSTTTGAPADVDVQDTGKRRIILTDTTSKKPMVVLDGGPMMTWQAFEKLDIKPEQIESMNVFKGENAVAKYGQKGKEGVLEITLKATAVKSDEPTFARVFTRVENPPYYGAGMLAFAKYIEANLRYPQQATDNKKEGAVTIQFIVDEKGGLSHFKKLSDVGFGLEDEAIRLLQQSGEWNPGIQNGNKVPVQVEQQVIFKLGANTVSREPTAVNIDIDKTLLWPMDHGLVNIGFGKQQVPGTQMIMNSDGIFISGTQGAPVRASAAGKVSSVFTLGDEKAVLVSHGNFYTTYSHLQQVTVKRGQTVDQGSLLGTIATNKSGVGELLFIVSDNMGKVVDPERYLVKK